MSDDAIVDLSGVKLKDGGCTSTSLTCGDWLPLKSYPLLISMGTRALITMQGCVIQPEYGHGVQARYLVITPSTTLRHRAPLTLTLHPWRVGGQRSLLRQHRLQAVHGLPLLRTATEEWASTSDDDLRRQECCEAR